MKYTPVILLLFISATLGVRLECYTCDDVCGKSPDTWNRVNCSLPNKENFLCQHKKQNGNVYKQCISNEMAHIEACDAINKKKKNSDDYCFYCERDLCNVNSSQIHIESCVILSFGAIVMRFVL
ncbi:uncharacterized protein LOC123004366 [Tribolium madens]|uniref:uncharacterized protein LOC123004366 n=1 Tax=Tribolium madens TaxID=41895 RepID=UPI001CF74A59|nr:uncharacterized protein LOC123004366 [Tribolium madens]